MPLAQAPRLAMLAARVAWLVLLAARVAWLGLLAAHMAWVATLAARAARLAERRVGARGGLGRPRRGRQDQSKTTALRARGLAHSGLKRKGSSLAFANDGDEDWNVEAICSSFVQDSGFRKEEIGNLKLDPAKRDQFPISIFQFPPS
jgi:hypothetical protein